jgi:PAS domain S-box-containing protein
LVSFLQDPGSQAAVSETIETVVTTKRPAQVEFILRGRDGEDRRILSTAYPVTDPEDHVAEVILSNRDITRLRLAQQALQESEERHKALADASFEGILIGRNGAILHVNQNLADLSGYEVDELAGMLVSDLTPEEYQGLSFGAIVPDTGAVYEYQFFRKDGSTAPVEVRGKTIPYGGTSATVWSIRDISDRKRAEEALRENESRLRAILESARDGIFMKDVQFRYVHVNPAMANLAGLQPSEFIGRTARDVYGAEAGIHIMEVERRVLQGETVEEEHTRSVRGERLTFHDVSAPLRNTKGDIIGLFGISRNVTERKKMTPSAVAAGTDYPSPAMKNTLSQARQVAAKEGIVLLQGESGSGKDYVAQWIHDHSRRANGPFFAINCAALPPELAESELFGHEPGAFTGARGRKRGLLELAEGGTLLLNEVGELSLFVQSKLLTFLDTRSFMRVGGEKSIHVNARIIAATHRKLDEEVAAGRFLEPLYYRLNVFSITVPPLRERMEDIPVLVREIVISLSSQMNLPEEPILDPQVLSGLTRYSWPGNVRELRNILERALMLWEGGPLEVGPPFHSRGGDSWSYPVSFSSPFLLHQLSVEFRRAVCAEAIRRCGNNKVRAARLLGVSRDTLYRYMKE